MKFLRNFFRSKQSGVVSGSNNVILEAPRPNFRMKMSGANIFAVDGATGIALEASIWNIGGPSAVVGWELTVVPAQRAPVTAKVSKIPEILTLSGERATDSTALYGSHALDTKVSTKPVESTPIAGTLLFYVPMDREILLEPSTKFVLAAEDIFGGKTEASRTIAEWQA